MKKLLMIAATALILPLTASADRSGEEVYNAHCSVCHVAGVAGAPKLGDKDAWAPRIEKGLDALLATSISGVGAMPPKGTCMNCSDAELKASVEYMIEQSK